MANYIAIADDIAIPKYMAMLDYAGITGYAAMRHYVATGIWSYGSLQLTTVGDIKWHLGISHYTTIGAI